MKLIQTDEENAVVLHLIERLMKYDPTPESSEGKLLSLLADAVVNYEKKYDTTN